MWLTIVHTCTHTAKLLELQHHVNWLCKSNHSDNDLIFYFCRLLLSWAMHFATPVSSGAGGSSDNCSSFHCILCRSISSFNEIQVDMCTDVPQSLPVLTNAQPIIAGECKWQFRKEQWDCAGISTPIIEEPPLKCKLVKFKIYYISLNTDSECGTV